MNVTAKWEKQKEYFEKKFFPEKTTKYEPEFIKFAYKNSRKINLLLSSFYF